MYKSLDRAVIPFFNSPEYFPKVELNTPVPFGFPFLISPIYFQSFLSLPFSNHPNLPLTFLKYKTSKFKLVGEVKEK